MVRTLDAAVYFQDSEPAPPQRRTSDGPAAKFPRRFAVARADAEIEARRRAVAGRPARLAVVFRDGVFHIINPAARLRHEIILYETGDVVAGYTPEQRVETKKPSGAWSARVARKSAIDAAVAKAIDGEWRTAEQITGDAAKRLGFEPSISTTRERIVALERLGVVERRWQPCAAPKPSLEYRRIGSLK